MNLFLDQQGSSVVKPIPHSVFFRMKVPALGSNGTDSQYSIFIDVDDVIIK